MNINSLLKEVEKLEKAVAELATLKNAEPTLRAEVEKILGELEGIAPELLVLPSSSKEKLDEKTDLKLQQLKFLRTKLELLPNHVARYERLVEDQGKELEQLLASERHDLRQVARERLNAESAKLGLYFLDECGGNVERAKAAVKASLEYTEAHRWVTVLGYGFQGQTPAERARQCIALKAAFDAGRPFSAVAA